MSAIVFALLLLGLQGPEARTQAPERGTPLLGIDFAAVTRDGHPIGDIRPDEVTVKIDGRTRAVRSLQLITVATAPAPAAGGPDLPLPFGSNAESEVGRTIALVIDDDSFRPGREGPLRDAVAEFLAALPRRDRVSLVTMPYGGVKVPFTTEHSRVRTALATLVGHGAADESGSDLACRTRRTLESLVGYLASLGVREKPASVLFVSAGMAAPRRDAPVTMAPGRCELPSDLFRQVGLAAGAARTQFYVIQPDAIMARTGPGPAENIAGRGFAGSDNPLEGLEHLAGVTGGMLLHLTGSQETALARVARESSAYYLATIDPLPSDRGHPHRLEVRVSRRGAEVRTRPDITFPQIDRMSRLPQQPAPRDMLGVADVFRDLPLRASAYSSVATDPGKVRVIAIAEAADSRAKLTSLVAGLFDRDGRLVANWVAAPMDLARTPVLGAMDVEPAGYRLRVAAIDSTGRAGTADYDLTAEVATAGPLRLSSLALGLSREGGFTPRLQFGAEPVAIAQLEIHGGEPGARLSVALELASSPHGPPMVVLPLALRPAGDRHYVASGALPIGSLPPGDYAVRALVGLEGHAIARIVRTLRKQ